MSRRRRPHYRSDLGWILGVAFEGTLTRSARPAQGFAFARCCGSPRVSSPHGLTAPEMSSFNATLRAVTSGSRLLPTRSAKDFHLQFSAHARHTSLRCAPFVQPVPREACCPLPTPPLARPREAGRGLLSGSTGQGKQEEAEERSGADHFPPWPCWNCP